MNIQKQFKALFNSVYTDIATITALQNDIYTAQTKGGAVISLKGNAGFNIGDTVYYNAHNNTITAKAPDVETVDIEL